uniref:Uncharacterized protein n=1 Tax=Anopheles minimus TaxID=112268 RepID=A0A182W3Z8_9DIPT
MQTILHTTASAATETGAIRFARCCATSPVYHLVPISAYDLDIWIVEQGATHTRPLGGVTLGVHVQGNQGVCVLGAIIKHP